MAAAVKLKTNGFDGNITIYEASNHLGGRVASFPIPEFGREADNSHLMIQANTNLLNYLRALKAEYTVSEFVPALYPQKRKIKGIFRLAMKSIFNTESGVPLSLLCKTLAAALRNPYPLFPNDTLSKTFIKPFEKFAEENNIKIVFNTVCTSFVQENLTLKKADGQDLQIPAGEAKIIFALPPYALNRIIPNFDLEKIKYNPIANVHFLLDESCDLPFNFVGYVGGKADWYKVKGNLLSANISDCKETINADDIFDEAKQIFSLPEKYEKCKCVVEKFATISQDKENLGIRDLCLYGLSDLPAEFAGDWTVKELPCTMEAAVTSGFRAAEKVLKESENAN